MLFDVLLNDPFFSTQRYLLGTPPRDSKQLSSYSDARSKVDGDNLIVSVDLPGVSKDDLEVTVEGRTLKISAKRADLDSTSTHRYTIQKDWDVDSATSELRDGVLTLKFERSAATKPKRLLVK